MPYLNLDLDYFTHPKTIRLIGLLGRGAAELPIRLWSYCGKYHCESGNLAGHSAQEIEALVGWWGPSGKMVEAMIAVGFLKETEGGFKIHDWLDHAGHLSAFKKRAKTAAKKRWKAYASSNASSIAKKKIKQSSLPTLPDQSLPNQTKPKKLKHKIPEDFAVSDKIREWAKAEGLPDPDLEFGHFRDHHTANGSIFADWDAALRTWIRNSKRFNKSPAEKPKSTFVEKMRAKEGKNGT